MSRAVRGQAEMYAESAGDCTSARIPRPARNRSRMRLPLSALVVALPRRRVAPGALGRVWCVRRCSDGAHLRIQCSATRHTHTHARDAPKLSASQISPTSLQIRRTGNHGSRGAVFLPNTRERSMSGRGMSTSVHCCAAWYISVITFREVAVNNGFS